MFKIKLHKKNKNWILNMRLGDSKKIQDIIFTVQKSGISGSGTPGDPWITTTGPGDTQTVTATTSGQGQGSATAVTGFLKIQASSSSGEGGGSNSAVFSVNGQEKFRSTTGGGFSSRIEIGDSISFSTEGGAEGTEGGAEGTEGSSFAWSFHVEVFSSSSSSSAPSSSSSSAPNPAPPTSTPVPEPTSTPVPEPTSTTAPEPTSTPVPEPTSTPTSTPTNYDTTITVPSGSNKINGNGVTLVSTVGNSVSYNNLINFAGTPFNILVYVSNVQVALITITNPYIGKPFRFTTNSGSSYEGTFEMDGRIDF